MRIVFFGTPLFAIPTLSILAASEDEIAAVVTQPDTRKGRDKVPSPSPVKAWALAHHYPVLQPSTLKDPAFRETLEHFAPEVIVVVAYGKILPPAVLELPPHGCVNLHASLLPKYRGAAPIQWAIINGEEVTGVTTMLMNQGLDTGDILLQEVVPIDVDDTAETLSGKLSEIGASLMLRTLQGIKNGTLKRVPQVGPPSYAPPLKKEDGRIRWTKSAISIANAVRGMYPWPGAYCYFDRERLTITRAKAVSGEGIPGRIEKARGEEFLVGTGEGLLAILEVHPEGKRRMSAGEFLRGRDLQEGMLLDGP